LGDFDEAIGIAEHGPPQAGQQRRLGMPETGRDHRLARFQVQVEEPRIALAAGAGQHRPGMGLVEPLVGREAHIAIDAEDAPHRIARQRYPGLAKRGPDRVDQRAKRRKNLGFVDAFTRLEPARVVIAAQPAEKRERGRAKSGEAMRGNGHFRAYIRNSRLPAGPVIGLSVMPITCQPGCAPTQPAIRSQTARWMAGSRTTPPFPTSLGPASNCGLNNATNPANSAVNAKGAGSKVASPIKLASQVTRSIGSAISARDR